MITAQCLSVQAVIVSRRYSSILSHFPSFLVISALHPPHFPSDVASSLCLCVHLCMSQCLYVVCVGLHPFQVVFPDNRITILSLFTVSEPVGWIKHCIVYSAGVTLRKGLVKLYKAGLAGSLAGNIKDSNSVTPQEAAVV